jgi:hypothetical protein
VGSRRANGNEHRCLRNCNAARRTFDTSTSSKRHVYRARSIHRDAGTAEGNKGRLARAPCRRAVEGGGAQFGSPPHFHLAASTPPTLQRAVAIVFREPLLVPLDPSIAKRQDSVAALDHREHTERPMQADEECSRRGCGTLHSIHAIRAVLFSVPPSKPRCRPFP